ncbi:hypothetical protein [Microbacterium sp. NPDC057650]|uniref:hypothetical protein n=1 Tax=unclassified Microbacterium TaxID=2609290 RepID=UPI00366C0EF1
MSQRAEAEAVTERGSSPLGWTAVGLAAVSVALGIVDAWEVIEVYVASGFSFALYEDPPSGRLGVVVALLSVIALVMGVCALRRRRGGRPAIWAIILAASALVLEVLVPMIMQLLLAVLPIGYFVFRLWTM